MIASKPKDAATPAVSARSVPEIWATPASPARAPARTMTTTKPRVTEMPAVRAARGLAPTARSSKPIVERLSSQATNTVARTASTNPQCSRNCSPSSLGNIAVSATWGLTGFEEPGRRNAGRVSSQATRLSAM